MTFALPKFEKQQKFTVITKKSANLPTAVINFVNSALGPGLLGIPLAFAKAGIVPGVVILTSMGTICITSLYFLAYTSKKTNCFSFGEMTLYAFGLKGAIFVEFCNFCSTFGTLWSCLIMIGSFMSSLFRGIGFSENSILCKPWFIIIILSTVVIQPLSWLKTLNSLRFTSFLGLSSITFCVCVVVIRYFIPFNENVDFTHVEAVHPSVSIIQAFSTLSFVFSCHQNIPLIQRELENHSKEKMIRAGVIGTVLIAVLYLVAGLFGYMQFSGILLSRMDSGSFLDLYEDKDYLIIASKIAILLTLIFSCPMNSLPARISLQSLLSNIKKALSILKEKACNEADNSIDLPMENDPKLEQEHPKNVNVTSTKNQIAIEVDAISSDCCYGDCDSSLKICELGSCDRLFCNTDDNELQMESTNKEESLKSSCSSNKIIESVQKQNQLTDGKSKKDKVEKACEDNKKNFQRTIISKGTFVSCVIGTCLVACASILAIFANRVNFVFDLIGSTAGVVVSFIAPALMYLHELKEERNRTELKITEILDISSETVCEHDHINAKKNRATECIEPEILSEQIIRSAKHKKGFGYILGWFVFWLGALLGLCSLALTIIFDTDLVKLVNW